MMDALDFANIRLLIVICLLLLTQPIFSQEGFISIQCCVDGKFTERNTSLSYIPDTSWYPDRQSCQDTIWTGHDNSNSSAARFFSSEYDTKWCYELPTEIGLIYSIRALFPITNLQQSLPGNFFNVSVGVTEIAKVISVNQATVEALYRCTNNYTSFCLVKGKGDASLSKLELRPAHPDYLKSDSSIMLKLVDRVANGNITAAIRYPFDPHDRIWRPDVYSDPTASYISQQTGNVSHSDASSILAPLQVLQTAITHPERLQYVYNNLDEGNYEYYVYIHFHELVDSVLAGQRVFEIYINDKKMQEVDIVASGSRYALVDLNITANGVLNLTLVKALDSSLLGPICSAYEIFQVYARNQETASEEVEAMTHVKNEILVHNQQSQVLKTWSGDPCLPIPWHGVSCETLNGNSVITQIDLSLNGLTGPLPPSITKQMYLKELNVSNNGFTGTIPEFPSSCLLTSLDLSNNNLRVNLTQAVSSMAYLTTLYNGCNLQLSKSFSPKLNRLNLNTDKGICSSPTSSHPNQKIIIGIVASGSILITIVVGMCFVCMYRIKKQALTKYRTKGHAMSKTAVYSIASTETMLAKSIHIQCFTLEYIENVTDKYKILIGEGGFGPVYSGTLPDGQEVAVKVRSATSTQGTREFDNERKFLSAIQHENLVPLLGSCCENEQQILVYPFMSNGSLQDRLYGAAAKRKILDWPTRLSIALGAARGLTYLHTYSDRCVIHRDVKSSNILLDHSMCAKVADFGFSKYAPQEGDSGTSLEVRGTAGYLDPEYYSTQHLSAKSDVFSFGVVLLEIVCGREPLNINRPRNEWSLVEWAKPHIKNSKVEVIVDPSIKGGYHAEALWRVVEVALACIEPYSAYRPCMSDIVRELEDAFIIENNASEYMKSMESFGGSFRYSVERPIIVIPSTSIPNEASPILLQPPPPQPR